MILFDLSLLHFWPTSLQRQTLSSGQTGYNSVLAVWESYWIPLTVNLRTISHYFSTQWWCALACGEKGTSKWKQEDELALTYLSKASTLNWSSLRFRDWGQESFLLVPVNEHNFLPSPCQACLFAKLGHAKPHPPLMEFMYLPQSMHKPIYVKANL